MNDKKEMTVCVGDKKMKENEFKKMIAEMEKEQAPFKKQIEEELLPAYKKFLKEKFKQKTVEKHFAVADLFLGRALFMGFVSYEFIRSCYAFCEFPLWWQNHVMWKMSEIEIENSIKI